jgi:hypothetical protein
MELEWALLKDEKIAYVLDMESNESLESMFLR